MVAHSETAAALPAGQAQLTAQARKESGKELQEKHLLKVGHTWVNSETFNQQTSMACTWQLTNNFTPSQSA